MVCKFPNVWMVAGVVSLVRWSLVTNVNGTFRSRRCRVFLLKIIAHTALLLRLPYPPTSYRPDLFPLRLPTCTTFTTTTTTSTPPSLAHLNTF